MGQKEFLDLLAYYLRPLPQLVIDDILADYEEHFESALLQGKSEAAIVHELGSPELLAQEYLDNERISIDENPFFESNRSRNFSWVIFLLALPLLIPLLITIVLVGIATVALVVSLGLAGLSLGGSSLLIAFSLPVSILMPLTNQHWNLGLLNLLHPSTKIFLSIGLIALAYLLIVFSIWLVRQLSHLIRKLFVAIRWRYLRHKSQKEL